MNLEEVRRKLVGRMVVRVEAKEWDEKREWLSSPGSVRI